VRYRKKPVEVEAVQLLWTNWNEMCDFADVGSLKDGKPEGTFIDENGNSTGREYPGDGDRPIEGARIGLAIPTLEGVMLGTEGDFIIRGVQGELYPIGRSDPSRRPTSPSSTDHGRQDQNGKAEGSLSVTASFQPSCAPPMTVVYTSIVLTDVTSGISVTL
jgi:hypothetical protein